MPSKYKQGSEQPRLTLQRHINRHPMHITISLTTGPSSISSRRVVPVGLLLGSIGLLGVARADVPKSFSSGQALSAEDLNDSFEALDQRVNEVRTFHDTVSADIATLKASLGAIQDLTTRVAATESTQSELTVRLDVAESSLDALSLHAVADCATSGPVTQCVCAADEIAVSAGVLATSTSGNGFIVESRNVGPGVVPGTTWQTVCKTDAGTVVACAVTTVFCLRIN